MCGGDPKTTLQELDTENFSPHVRGGGEPLARVMEECFRNFSLLTQGCFFYNIVVYRIAV